MRVWEVGKDLARDVDVLSCLSGSARIALRWYSTIHWI
jgi:hypothetical protein